MVKSIFDDLGVIRELRMRATTFILGIWGLAIEKVVNKFAKIQVPG